MNDEREHVMSRKQKVRLSRHIHDINLCEDFQKGLLESQKGDLRKNFNECENPDEGCEVLHVQCRMISEDDVGEVFSMPRVVPAAERAGLKGKSYDIGNGWDFLRSDHRKQCREEMKRLKPQTLILSPPCGPFSQMLRISKFRCDDEKRKRKIMEGWVLLQFAMELCELQIKEGRVFLFEHPKGADSWTESCVSRVRDCHDVHEIVVDMCAFGLKDPQNGLPYKKGTRLLTNSKYYRLLEGKCPGCAKHQHIEGQTRIGGKWVNRSVCAQVYPKKFVDVLVRVAQREIRDRNVNEIKEVFVGEWI